MFFVFAGKTLIPFFVAMVGNEVGLGEIQHHWRYMGDASLYGPGCYSLMISEGIAVVIFSCFPKSISLSCIPVSPSLSRLLA